MVNNILTALLGGAVPAHIVSESGKTDLEIVFIGLPACIFWATSKSFVKILSDCLFVISIYLFPVSQFTPISCVRH